MSPRAWWVALAITLWLAFLVALLFLALDPSVVCSDTQPC